MNLKMDPYMLLSIVNTKLRNRYRTVAELAEEEALDQARLLEALKKIGYSYNDQTNQFVGEANEDH